MIEWMSLLWTITIVCSHVFKCVPIVIFLQQADLLDDSAHQRAPLTTRYDVCLDKGTYDAISLSPHVPQLNCRESYARCVQEIVRSGGMFILTSCNWTEEELKEHFTQGTTYCHLLKDISARRF